MWLQSFHSPILLPIISCHVSVRPSSVFSISSLTTMSILSMLEAKLPPGFRFHPRDDELICDYLAIKVAGDGGGSFRSCPVMVAVDLNKCEPWDLPDTACVGGKEWYFFSVRDRKYATGQRTNRATVSGYWKATGKDRSVKRNGLLVGMRKTLVFYKGRAPNGKKTDWVMHEYRIEDSDTTPRLPFKDDWVLCRVFFKSNGISTNSSMEKNHEDDSGPQSLPALVDNHFTINQTPLNLEGFEQVPCFSSITPGPRRRSPDLAPHLPSAEKDMSLARCFPQSVGFPHLRSGLSQFSGDIKFVKSVPVNHLTKLEAEPNLAEVCLGGYVTHTGIPSTWNPF